MTDFFSKPSSYKGVKKFYYSQPLLTEDEAERMTEYLKQNTNKIDETITSIWYSNHSGKIYFEGEYKNIYYDLVYRVGNNEIDLSIHQRPQGTFEISVKEDIIPLIKRLIKITKEEIN